MTHHRDRLFITTPPDNKEAVGHWWCNECRGWAPSCRAQDQHVWVTRWEVPDG